MLQRMMCALAILALAGCVTTSDQVVVIVDHPTDDPAYPKEARALPTSDERDDALQAIQDYTFGEDRAALAVVADQVTAALTDEHSAAAYSAALAAFLHTDATHHAKAFACRQLARVGQAKDAASIGKLLHDPALSDMARYALEAIEGEEVDEVLVASLSESEGEIQIGIINTLGERGAQNAIPALSDLADADDSAVVAAARNALVKIQRP